MRVPMLWVGFTLIGASTAFAVPQPDTVNVKNCYQAGWDDDQALHAALDVAMGTASGFADCGVSGSPKYIGTVFVPPGVYLLKTRLVLTKSVTLRGVRGRWTGAGSVIEANAGLATMIKVQTDDPVVIEDLQLMSHNQPAGSVAIYVGGGGVNSNNNSTLERVAITHAYTGVRLSAAGAFSIRNCQIEEPKTYGILIENTVNADTGDATIEGTVISSGVENSIGIRQISSGGLRLINNKIIGNYPTTQGMSIGYQLLLGDGAVTSILLITGNSIENQRDRGIQLTRTASNALFHMVTIGQNQIANQNVGIEIADAASPQSSAWLRSVSITGNVMMWQSSAGIAVHQVEGVFIASNVLHTMPTGIYLNTVGVTPTNVNISGNTYVSVPNHIVGSSVATLCPPSSCN